MLSGTKIDVPQSHFITEPLDIDAKVLLDCEASKVYYKWSLSDGTAFTVLSETDKNQRLSLKSFDLLLGINRLCLTVSPENSQESEPQEDCRYIDGKKPDPVAVLVNQDINNAVISENLVLNASKSYDPMDTKGVPEYLKPRALRYQWTCSRDTSLPSSGETSKGYQ